jgi:hypothetical protein
MSCFEYQRTELTGNLRKPSNSARDEHSAIPSFVIPTLQLRFRVRITVLGLALVHFFMSSQIAHDAEMATAPFDSASKRLLTSVAVHVHLKGAWSSEALVTDLALMLLLGIGRHLGTELRHHRLRCGWS